MLGLGNEIHNPISDYIELVLWGINPAMHMIISVITSYLTNKTPIKVLIIISEYGDCFAKLISRVFRSPESGNVDPCPSIQIRLQIRILNMFIRKEDYVMLK